MVQSNKQFPLSLLLLSFFLPSCSVSDVTQTNEAKPNENKSAWVNLIDKNLSQWELWMGVPHSSVTGLPEGTYQAENLKTNKGTPMGLDNDVKNVFSVIEQAGEPVLKITGEVYGGLTTINNYKNYHLTTQFKWGEQKWAPRLTAKRDSGILFHCQGEHGKFWNVWKACQEFQIQETDIGDFIPLAGPAAKVRSEFIEGSTKFTKYDPKGKLQLTQRYTSASKELDAPFGEWNTLDLYALGDLAVFMVNNEVVMVIEESIDSASKKLASGQIQIQSEGAELYYRGMKIRQITELPQSIKTMTTL